MDEQVSWKGQSFTLLVFGGIVFLCSIFFVLGMLVGRGQGQRAAESAVVNAAKKTADADDRAQEAKSAISSYETITTGKETNKDASKETSRETNSDTKPEAHASEPEKPAKPAPEPSKMASEKPAPAVVKMSYLQVAALEKDTAARKQVEELRKAGFPAVVVGGDGPNALHKVQVGPFATAADLDIAKRKLESMGFKPIRK